MSYIPQISDAEYDVMAVVWEKYPVTASEIIASMKESENRSPKTVRTMIGRLTDKGALTYEKQGRAFLYSPAVDKTEYILSRAERFLAKYYNGDLSAFLAFLLEECPPDKQTMSRIKILFKLSEARTDAADEPAKKKKASKKEKAAEKPEKTDKSEKTEKPVKAEKPAKPSKPSKPLKPVKEKSKDKQKEKDRAKAKAKKKKKRRSLFM